MKYSIRKESIIEIGTAGEKNSYSNLIWTLCLTALVTGGSVLAFSQVWGDLSPGTAKLLLMTFAAAGFTAAVELFRKKFPWITVVLFVLWIAFFALAGWNNLYSGTKLWLNVLSTRWDQIHEGGATAITMNVSDSAIMAFSAGIALLMGMLGYMIIKRHWIAGCFIYEMFWFVLILSTGVFNPLAGGIMITGFFGLCISTKQQVLTRRDFIWIGVVALIFCAGAQVLDQGEISSIRDMRESAAMKVHEVRYGEDVLVEGDLRKAEKLKSSDEEMLKVSSKQQKNLYLRGFVGSVYRDGEWKSLPGSAYGGDNSGMLRWLEKQNFEPLTQSARYSNIGTAANRHINNKVTVTVTGASRYYIYAPSSLHYVIDGRIKENRDTRFVGKGIFGQRQYSYNEKSDKRPSELIVTEKWVTSPDNDERRHYSKAEATYRNFVYENYVSVNPDIYKMANEMFWEDYDSETEGIYSMLSHLRKKLSEAVYYVDDPEPAPEGEDPIMWMLQVSHEGNDVYYASAGVAALRAKGVPARYVEGYYLSESKAKEAAGGAASLTGKDAHAWIEVYFDGVGWMPVDVTPGYYYDAISLSNMVNSPDSDRKSAAMKDQGEDARSSAKLDNKGGKGARVREAIKNAAAALAGALILLLLALCLIVAILEFGRVLLMHNQKKKYLRGDQKTRIHFAEESIFILLGTMGINASLGWNTEGVDAALAGKLKGIKPGQYARACQLVERSVYGDIELMANEMRTLEVFWENLYESLRTSDSRKMRLFMRYEWIYRRWVMRKQKKNSK